MLLALRPSLADFPFSEISVQAAPFWSKNGVPERSIYLKKRFSSWRSSPESCSARMDLKDLRRSFHCASVPTICSCASEEEEAACDGNRVAGYCSNSASGLNRPVTI